MAFFSKIFGDANEKYIKSLQPVIDKINSLEDEFEKLSDEELKGKSREFKEDLKKGDSLDDILPEAFAAVREAAKRTLGQRHFDVQLMGGIILHQGKISEMKTGEGNTLVSTLPAYLNALAEKGVHMVTVNDYLSRRDVVWMGQIYDALGLSVSCVNHDFSYIYDQNHVENKDQEASDKERDTLGSFHVVHEYLRPVEKREAYYADVTYGTNNEFGFDYLRDNMVHEPSQMAQREEGHHFAIIDEVDSILIDEARTPLIISAPDEDSTKLYGVFSKIAPSLEAEKDYTVDEKLKAISITDTGIDKVEKALGIENIYEEGGARYVHHLEQALKAHILFKKDKDYVVKDGQIIIVDEFTGRLMPGRRWSEGLHQSIEAKEKVGIQKESRTLATITFQNYFRLYEKLSGMTGTAQSSAEEFYKVYSLDVKVVPTNKPLIRDDKVDRIYKTDDGKLRAVVREIKELNKKGQPVLVGTVSIEKNEFLSAMLNRDGVKYNLLNAKNHESEAEILSQAGKINAVTIATNMAGRGVDIVLGGNPYVQEDADRVKELGGLHVIGTERHEARRIDDQLRGRSGRQGDPGSTQFFVSTEDDVVRVFGGDRLKNLMETLGVGEDDVIENKFVSRAIQQAQGKIEGHNFDMRKYVLEYDDVMNKHRSAIYTIRRKVLFSESSKEIIEDYITNFIVNLVNSHMATKEYEGQGNMKEIAEAIKTMVGAKESGALESNLNEKAKSNNPEDVIDFLEKNIDDVYELKEKEVGSDNMRKLEKAVLLRTIDELWMDHIDAMEYLRDSVRLRAYGQRDPLIEYRIEGQKMFDNLTDAMEVQVANMIFKVSFIRQPQDVKMEERRPDMAQKNHGHNPAVNEPAHRQAAQQSQKNKIGRNDPCFCGSGKKFKKCHGK